jgi:hypothetical protein
MPLAVPGVNVALGDKTEWAQKLVGKKISDSATASDVNVRNASCVSATY